MKKLILSALFLVFNIGIYAQEKTYIIEIDSITLNFASISWFRADGSSEKDSTQPYTPYVGEYGIKGFERGNGSNLETSGANCVFFNLIPDTEYSLFIRKQSVSADSSVWFEEYNFKTLACNTELSNIHTVMKYADGFFIKDLLDVQITFNEVANSYELEYGLKGFEKGSGTIISSTENRFSIGNSNLQSNTEYDFYIRAKCNDMFREWSEKNSFVTTSVFHYKGAEAFDLNFENITNKSVTVQWKKIAGDAYSERYLIEYGPKGFVRGTGQTIFTRGNTCELIELNSDTNYSFFIRSNFLSSTDSAWFAEHLFKTDPCNTEISGIESREIWPTCYCNGADGIEIRWDDMADSYELEYGIKDYQQGTGKIIETYEGGNVHISPEDLVSFTDYDFYIRAKCDGVFGEWIGANTFSTTQLKTGIENLQIQNFEVFPNPVGDILYIKLNSTFDISNTIVYVFNMAGSIVLKSKYKADFNISSLPEGTYIVRVKDEKMSEAKIIQKE